MAKLIKKCVQVQTTLAMLTKHQITVADHAAQFTDQ